MIDIDGSYEEGGGQIIRTALTLSALTGKPFRIRDIRKNRPQPGLKAQHIACVRSVGKLCSAKHTGHSQGATEMEFIPGPLKVHSIDIDLGTAGSITLLLQCLLPVMIFGGKNAEVVVKGGTDVSFSPSIDYFREILLPHLRRYAEIEVNILKRGYYPQGGGEVRVKVKPRLKIRDFTSIPELVSAHGTRGIITLIQPREPIYVRGISHASKELMAARVAERQATGASLNFKDVQYPVKISSQYSETLSTGTSITLWMKQGDDLEGADEDNPIMLGADALGQKGVPAENVGEEAAKSIKASLESQACTDEHLSDQLLIFMGLFPGSCIKVPRITGHARSNIYTIEKFLDVKFRIDGQIVCSSKP